MADPRWSAAPIVLLTSGGQKSDSAHARDAGFAGFLVKPARSSLLRQLLAAAVAGRPAGEMLMRQRVETSLEQLRGKVLLVEDNEVNRRVAVAVLRKFGLDVTEAVNGRDALECVEAETFDLVLMDMHMPEMDGIEATRVIRARESNSVRRLPILAMTANVLAEAREACREAGMDDFVPKPFVRAQLVAALKRWLPGGVGGAKISPIAAGVVEPDAAALDHTRLDTLRSAMGDDFVELIPVFLDSAAEIVTAMRNAHAAADVENLYRQAHTLKSSAANLGAMVLSQLAKALEADARCGPVADGAARIDVLQAELERVQPLLVSVAAEVQPGVCDAVG